MRWLAILLVLSLAACATKMGKDGQTRTTMDAKYLIKTEVDRIADTVRGEAREGLMQIADKLYRRNPREWKKAGVASREAALARRHVAGRQHLGTRGRGQRMIADHHAAAADRGPLLVVERRCRPLS